LKYSPQKAADWTLSPISCSATPLQKLIALPPIENVTSPGGGWT
jgi:hypothetical protein